MSLLENMLRLGHVRQLVLFRQQVQEESSKEVQEEKGKRKGERPAPNIKGSPQKYRLESCAQYQIFITRWCSSLMLFDLE